MGLKTFQYFIMFIVICFSQSYHSIDNVRIAYMAIVSWLYSVLWIKYMYTFFILRICFFFLKFYISEIKLVKQKSNKYYTE